MNDWLDYKGSGSVRAYAADDELIHAFNFRSKIDKGVKALGDVITLPSKTGALGKQLKAYADLIAAKRELYTSLVSKANKSDSNQQYIKDNEILGPIVKSIEDNAKALPSIAGMALDTAATNLRSRR